MNILPANMRFGAGQPVKRLEDQRLLTGKGQFIDDRPEDGALWLYVLRSPHAHAKIASIDTTPAATMPGVEAVYTGADLVADDIGTIPTLAVFQRPDGKPMTVPPRRLLAHEIARFAGEPVAAVVATSRTAAQTAAEAIIVEYEVLPSVVDPMEAIKPGAPVVWPEAPDNIVAVMSYGDAAAVEAAFAKAAHVVSLDLVSQRLFPSAMEPRSTIAEIEKKSGRLILHVQSQTPGSTRDVLAEAVLKRPKESVRVLVGDIGGGFGHKTNLYPEDGMVAYAAVKLKRKIRWRGDRTDEFVGGTHGRDLTSTGEFALDAKGRVLAYRVRSIGGTGAYMTGAANIIPLVLGPFVQSGVYDLPLVHYEAKTVMTNTAPVGAYRGAGRPEGVFIVERLMDAAARQIGIDPRTIRKVNYIKPAQLPYTNSARYMTAARSRTCWTVPQNLPIGTALPRARRLPGKKACSTAAASPATSNGPAGARIPKRSACTPRRRDASCCIRARRRWGRGCRPPIRRCWRSRSASPWTKSTSCRVILILPPVSAASARARCSSVAPRSRSPATIWSRRRERRLRTCWKPLSRTSNTMVAG
jgi:carbon-monoxide dehydrogenase large subunit